MIHLFWAKKPRSGGAFRCLPLLAHLRDTAQVAGLLWDRWVPESMKQRFSQKLLVFLAAVHDLGKATPVFQSKSSIFPNEELDEALRWRLRDAGFPLKDKYSDASKVRHELVSHAILRRNGLCKSLCVVLSGHHGKPPSDAQIDGLNAYPSHLGFDDERWRKAQDDLLGQALECAGFTLDEACQLCFTRPEQVLLSGLVILSDWIASDEGRFPLVDADGTDDIIDSKRRAETAFEKLALPPRWEPDAGSGMIYQERFCIPENRERPIQKAALAIAHMSPGIMVIEAPMGEGKTEAALAAAEVLAGENGLRGIYFALPTQATSNAMFDRVMAWIETFDRGDEKYSVRLAHGKAELNDRYRRIMKLTDAVSTDGEEDDAAFVYEWFSGRKKSLLADFAVGTIDHVLMAALKQKHLALRHLGLAGKVVVIDEVHAYDVYMNSYLSCALAWLGAYGVPVVVLSATLPAGRRLDLIDAYTGKKTDHPVPSSAYPLITYTRGGAIEYEEIPGGQRARIASLRRIGDGALADELESALSGGGCAGVIVNTVGRAQEMYLRLRERFGEECVYLLHARLLACDRSRLEDNLSRWLGPPDKAKQRPKKLILIGTQVLEQSLDFDFDILASDLCPMDLLLQRMGRLHRHERERPERLHTPACLMLRAGEATLERGAETVYGTYLLLRTRALLPEEVTLPGDIPHLVAGVYDAENSEELAEVREADCAKNEKRLAHAKDFQVGLPNIKKPLFGWLDTSLRDDSEKRGEAAVRDGADSVEVIVIRRINDALCLLPWIGNGQAIPRGIPDPTFARMLSGCSVRLPALFGGEWIVDRAIKELEEAMVKLRLQKAWYAVPLLKGALSLILDESMKATLCGYRLSYDQALGLRHEKEE